MNTITEILNENHIDVNILLDVLDSHRKYLSDDLGCLVNKDITIDHIQRTNEFIVVVKLLDYLIYEKKVLKKKPS